MQAASLMTAALRREFPEFDGVAATRAGTASTVAAIDVSMDVSKPSSARVASEFATSIEDGSFVRAVERATKVGLTQEPFEGVRVREVVGGGGAVESTTTTTTTTSTTKAAKKEEDDDDVDVTLVAIAAAGAIAGGLCCVLVLFCACRERARRERNYDIEEDDQGVVRRRRRRERGKRGVEIRLNFDDE